jgi:hypothetical protein
MSPKWGFAKKIIEILSFQIGKLFMGFAPGQKRTSSIEAMNRKVSDKLID